MSIKNIDSLLVFWSLKFVYENFGGGINELFVFLSG